MTDQTQEAAQPPVRVWEVRSVSGRSVHVLATDQDQAFRRAARHLGASPLRATAYGPWSRP